MTLLANGIQSRSKYTGGFRVDLDSIAWEWVNLESARPKPGLRYEVLEWPSSSTQLKFNHSVSEAI